MDQQQGGNAAAAVSQTVRNRLIARTASGITIVTYITPLLRNRDGSITLPKIGTYTEDVTEESLNILLENHRAFLRFLERKVGDRTLGLMPIERV